MEKILGIGYFTPGIYYRYRRLPLFEGVTFYYQDGVKIKDKFLATFDRGICDSKHELVITPEQGLSGDYSFRPFHSMDVLKMINDIMDFKQWKQSKKPEMYFGDILSNTPMINPHLKVCRDINDVILLHYPKLEHADHDEITLLQVMKICDKLMEKHFKPFMFKTGNFYSLDFSLLNVRLEDWGPVEIRRYDIAILEAHQNNHYEDGLEKEYYGIRTNDENSYDRNISKQLSKYYR